MFVTSLSFWSSSLSLDDDRTTGFLNRAYNLSSTSSFMTSFLFCFAFSDSSSSSARRSSTDASPYSWSFSISWTCFDWFPRVLLIDVVRSPTYSLQAVADILKLCVQLLLFLQLVLSYNGLKLKRERTFMLYTKTRSSRYIHFVVCPIRRYYFIGDNWIPPPIWLLLREKDIEHFFPNFYYERHVNIVKNLNIFLENYNNFD